MLINSRRILLAFINAVLMMPLLAQQNPTPAAATQQDPQSQAALQGNRFQARRQQQQRFNAFAQALSLGEEQKRQIIGIEREAGRGVWTVRRDASLTEEDKQQKIKVIRTQQRQKLVALLTPEQQQALKKWIEEQKLKHGSKAGDKPGDPSQAKPNDDDDFFAGIVQDPDPPVEAQAANQKPPEN